MGRFKGTNADLKTHREETILWRRLDAPGHDACRLLRTDDGWRLEGAASLALDGSPASLAYVVDCDAEWRTRQGSVYGWIGARSLDLRIVRSADGVWRLNDESVPDLAECVDLDLGFTPATNLSQLRRVDLEIGNAADVPVAWLDVQAGTLDKLHQFYERRSAESYWYEAARFGYTALLRVNEVGFVEMYPELWELEGRSQR